MSKVVSSKQKQLIDETIAAQGVGDSSVFYEHTDIAICNDLVKKRKLTQKLVAASKFRIYIFGKSKIQGKHGLEKDFPLIYLEEVGLDSQQLFLKFNFPGKCAVVYLFIQSERIDVLVNEVLKNYRAITFGWPGEVSMQITSKDLKPLPDGANYDPGHCNGLIHCYYAFCNLRGTQVKSNLVQFLKDCDERKCVDLDLSECPGIEGKSELYVDLVTLGYALRYNTYFRSFTLRNVDNKEVFQALARVLRGNSTLSRVVCVGTNGDVYERIGDFVRSNTSHKLQIIQFSNSRFSNRAAIGLSRALTSFPHVLRVLDLQNCNMQGSGITSVVNSLRSNFGMSLGLEELNLSHNQFNSTASNNFLSWIKDIRKHGSIQRLSVANTGLLIGPLVLELNLLPIKYLDVSDCKFDKWTMDNLSHFAETTKTIQTLRLSNCSITPEILAKTLRSLFGNDQLKDLRIDISRNALGPKGATVIAPMFKIASNLSDLDLSDNGIKEKGLISIVNVLPTGIQRLILDGNFSEKGESDELSQALSSLIASRPNLYHLSLVGSASGRIGKSLSTLFTALKNNITLQELDITDNQVGEVAFSRLTECLCTNVGLRALRCDLNALGYPAYQCLRQTLNHNLALSYIEWPTLDFEQAGKNNTTKFHKILCEIYSICDSRRSRSPDKISPIYAQSSNITSNGWTNHFDFDTRWETPTDPPKALVDVPVELNDVVKNNDELGVDAIDNDAVFDDDLFTPHMSPRLSLGSSFSTLPKLDSSNSIKDEAVDSPRDNDQAKRTQSIDKRKSRSKKQRATRVLSSWVSVNDENSPLATVIVPAPEHTPEIPALSSVPPPMDDPPLSPRLLPTSSLSPPSVALTTTYNPKVVPETTLSPYTIGTYDNSDEANMSTNTNVLSETTNNMSSSRQQMSGNAKEKGLSTFPSVTEIGVLENGADN